MGAPPAQDGRALGQRGARGCGRRGETGVLGGAALRVGGVGGVVGGQKGILFGEPPSNGFGVGFALRHGDNLGFRYAPPCLHLGGEQPDGGDHLLRIVPSERMGLLCQLEDTDVIRSEEVATEAFDVGKVEQDLRVAVLDCDVGGRRCRVSTNFKFADLDSHMPPFKTFV